LTDAVAPAESEPNRLHPNAKRPELRTLIDIERQKEVLQQILIDVIGFRGVGITGDGRRFVGGERQGGAGNAELRTIMLDCLLSSECF
jgi:hypothetical protein